MNLVFQPESETLVSNTTFGKGHNFKIQIVAQHSIVLVSDPVFPISRHKCNRKVNARDAYRYIKPEDHWSCIVHLSAEDILKSEVIEEV